MRVSTHVCLIGAVVSRRRRRSQRCAAHNHASQSHPQESERETKAEMHRRDEEETSARSVARTWVLCLERLGEPADLDQIGEGGRDQKQQRHRHQLRAKVVPRCEHRAEVQSGEQASDGWRPATCGKEATDRRAEHCQLREQ